MMTRIVLVRELGDLDEGDFMTSSETGFGNANA
jgi:hypothetical protein